MDQKVTLKKLSLQNFKVVKDYTVEFDDVTTISGENGTGKTTIFDAFLWCLFGKDSSDRTDSGRGGFTIKTVDTTGKEIERLQHTVTAVLDINGKEKTLTRSLCENWVKPKGEAEVVLRGNSTHYFIEGVEVKAAQYQAEVADIIEEQLFKLITNPNYFPSLKWETQREILLRIAGGVTYEEVAADRKDFLAIIKQLGGKDMASFKENIAYRKKVVKAELEKCPIEINAINSVTPEAKDYDALEARKDELSQQVEEVDAEITNAAETQRKRFMAAREKQQEVNDLRTKQQDLVFKAKQEAQRKGYEANARRNQLLAELLATKRELENARTLSKREEDDLQRRRQDAVAKVERLNGERNGKLAEWESKNAEEYKQTGTGLICPIYKKLCSDASVLKLDEEAKKKAKEAFDDAKEAALTRITEEGQAINVRIAEGKTFIQQTDEQIAEAQKAGEAKAAELDAKIGQMETELQATPAVEVSTDIQPAELPEWVELEERIKGLTAQQAEEPEEQGATPNGALIEKKKQLTAELDSVKGQLAERAVIQKNEAQKAEITKREKELAQQLANLEKEEFTADELNKARMDEVERRVNSRFQNVRFRMFEKQLNGGEVPTCVATVNGVKYADLNTAGKINAGLDIINTLCLYHGVTAPVFIDNAESVNELFPIASQLVRLAVSKEPQLTVTKY